MRHALVMLALGGCVRAGFTDDPLQLSSVHPKSSPVGVSTLLSIKGAGFEQGSTIQIGGMDCLEVKFRSSTDVTCLSPLLAEGPADVTATVTEGHTAVLPGGFIVYRAATADATFGNEGVVTTDIAGGNDYIWDSVVLLDDDRILIVGEFSVGQTGVRQPLLARYTPNGQLDSSFGTGGLVKVPVPPGFKQAWYCDHKLTSDGRIVAAGNGRDADGHVLTHIARFWGDGRRDTTFAKDGVWSAQIGDSIDHSCQIELDQTDAIYVGGHMNAGTDFDVQLLRLRADGQIDVTYGANGRFRIDPGLEELSFDFALLPDRRAVMGVAESPRVRLMGVTSDGHLDTAFGEGGYVALPSGDTAAGMNRILLQDDGTMLVFGQTSDATTSTGHDAAIWRILPGGVLDTDFGANGVAVGDFNHATDTAYDGTVLPDGRIVAVGDSRGSYGDGAIWAFTATGVVDTSAGSGSLLVDVNGEHDRFYAVEQDSFGRLVAVGRTDNGTDRDLLIVRRWP
jgi:uncharacterized delta-60 repeat protein